MKTKSILKMLSTAVTTAMIAAAVVFPASASEFTYEPVEGDTTSFKKYLVMPETAEVPNITFDFEIVAGDAIPADPGTSVEIIPGPDADEVDIESAVFQQSDDSYNTVQNGDDSVTLAPGEKYAVKDVEVDFSGVEFDEPGVYRYILTETVPTTDVPAGVTYDDSELTLDVYVVDNNGTLEVASYVLHTGTAAPAAGGDYGTADVADPNDPVDDKTDNFQNSYETHDLYIAKVVSGNQASKDKYFKIEVTISGLNEGDTLPVDRTHCDEDVGSNSATLDAYETESNPTELVADSNGEATGVFYLQHEQYVVIQGIPTGADYTVAETPEDYSEEDSIAADDSPLNWDADADNDEMADDLAETMGNADIHVGFTNTKSGIIPTGIIMKVGPIIAVGVVVIAGAAFFMVRSMRRKVLEAGEAEETEE